MAKEKQKAKKKDKTDKGETKKRKKKASAKKKDVTKKASKKAKTKSKTKKTSKQKQKITPEERLEMIRTAAYYLAQKRGYQGNCEMSDWIDAEKEIDAETK